MRWNRHLNLQGEHAFLSPSTYHWINYNHARLLQRWTAAQAGAYGNMQHEYAQQEIKAKRESGLIGTVGQYINDAIRYRMETEQVRHCSVSSMATTRSESRSSFGFTRPMRSRFFVLTRKSSGSSWRRSWSSTTFSNIGSERRPRNSHQGRPPRALRNSPPFRSISVGIWRT
jgi:hypothetical protein